MAVSVELNTPLAEALNEVVQPKLVEVGWSTGGGDDSALAEYVILMLVNGKTQEQISAELANDLLGLGPDDTEAVDFSRWLFEQVESLNKQLNGGPSEAPQEQPAAQAIPSYSEEGNNDAPVENTTSKADAEMGDISEGRDNAVPTGPRTMRNQKQGRGRLLGQLSRAMDRSSDSVLHRVRNQQGTERINTHGREPPKGPRGGRNGRAPMGRHMGGMGSNMGMGHMGMNNNPMQNMPPQPNMMAMTPQQQMQMMAMFEEQSRMMAQFMPGFNAPAMNPAFQNGPPQQQQGRSLFERAEFQPNKNFSSQRREGQHNGNAGGRQAQETSADVEMGADQGTAESFTMDTSGSKESPGPDTVCRFNLKCTNKDCPFAHQSPAAPEGTNVDTSDHCPFGAACKNRKCVARHPSPAQKSVHQADELCKFYPYCNNPNCSFKHPSMPLCRNGADCSASGCKFTHTQVPCKYNPCLNRSCPYKHAEGQKGVFTDKVWRANGGEESEKMHVSERKFIADDNEEEELIKPGSAPAPNETGIFT